MSSQQTPSSEPHDQLPPRLPVTADSRFEKHYARDPWLCVPSIIKEKLWWESEGARLKYENMAKAAVQSEQCKRWYIDRCKEVDALNATVRQKNALREAENEMQELKRRLTYRPPTPERFEKLRDFLRKRLKATLEEQRAPMRSMFLRAVGVTFIKEAPLALFVTFLVALLVMGLWFHGHPTDLVKAVPWGDLLRYKTLNVWGLVLGKLVTPLLFFCFFAYCEEFATRLLKLLRDPESKKHSKFWLHYELPSKRQSGCFYTPVMLGHPDAPESARGSFLESDPFNVDKYLRPKVIRFATCGVSLCFWAMVVGWFVPTVMLLSLVGFNLIIVVVGAQCSQSVTRMELLDALRLRWEGREKRLLQVFEQEFESLRFRYLSRTEPRDSALCKAHILKRIPRYKYPPRYTPTQPEPVYPPQSLYDDGKRGNYEHVLRGSRVYDLDDIRRLASYKLFEDGFLHPCLFFGGNPILHNEGQTPHILCVGNPGSAKTTTIQSLMSHLLPLAEDDLPSIQPPPYRETATELVLEQPLPPSDLWSRSFTYQAVVYNTKNENIPVLAGMGFRPGRNLFILDPADSRCHAWDLAADVDDRDSIRRFAALIVPHKTGDDGNTKRTDHWDDKARRLVEAVVISFRNMAKRTGQAPSWNLRDLVCAFRTQPDLREVLKWHDDCKAVLAELVDLDSKISDSNFTTATQFIRSLDITAARWQKAEEAGRKISLKHWLRSYPHSTLVLPNTMNNETVNEPLNRMFITFLTEAILVHENSFYKDRFGKEHPRRRFFFFDEVGQAGRLPQLFRLMTEARSFGTQVVLGVHQLSHLRNHYGENGTETLMGLCGTVALLRNGDPTTNQWASDRIGVCLREYEKESFSYGTSEGKAFTTSTSHTESRSEGASQQVGSGEGSSNSPNGYGPNGGYSTTRSQNSNTSQTYSNTYSSGYTEQESESTSSSKSEQTTKSTELRQEAAVYPSEFANLPDPKDTGIIGGYFITPSLPIWRADLELEEFLRRQSPPDNSVPRTVPWPDDEDASTLQPWNDADKRRLGCHIDTQLPNMPEEEKRTRLPTDFKNLG